MPADQYESAAIIRAVEATNQAWQQRLAQLQNDIKLRQWCVEQAIKVMQNGNYEFGPLVVAMHEFLTGEQNRKIPIDETKSEQ